VLELAAGITGLRPQPNPYEATSEATDAAEGNFIDSFRSNPNDDPLLGCCAPLRPGSTGSTSSMGVLGAEGSVGSSRGKKCSLIAMF
jgi:hypothetical protein